MMVGLPNSVGNQAQRGREREREIGKQQDKNKPYTFPLFSPFKTQIEMCWLSLFLLHQRFSLPLSSQRSMKKYIL